MYAKKNRYKEISQADWYAKENRYKEISQADLEQAKGNAWSIESMEGHDAGERSTTYIGSKRDEKYQYLIWDYYIDSSGAYWFKNRAIKDGQIVSMDVYLFGKKR